jgi:hypothetical protein
MNTPVKVVVTGSVVGFASIVAAYIWARNFHKNLATNVSHRVVDTRERNESRDSGTLESLPRQLVNDTDDYRIIHDRDEMVISNWRQIGDDRAATLFTALMRRNMSLFSRFPQSWMLWLIAKSPEQRQSFTQAHIKALDFSAGDLFCGFYRIVERRPTRVDINLEFPENGPPVGGMLILSLEQRDDGTLLRTDTVQWTRQASGAVLPLERPPFRFMHELASWYMLESGAKYVKDLRDRV